MPELPEVETVRQGLAPHLEGARLLKVTQNRADLRFPFPDGFAERLTGVRVTRLDRRAKYLRAELDSGETLVAHLGMTGRFTIDQRQPGQFHRAAGVDEKHTHLVFETDRGAVIAFNDARRFGYMDLIATDELCDHPWFKGLGPEPLDKAFNTRALGRAFEGRTQSVKATLLDQRIVAGLGNIYVSEALHRSRLDPHRPAGAVTAREVARLVAQIKAVLMDALEAGGSTLRDYRSADGDLGYFQHQFRVYDREGYPCPSPRCPGEVTRVVQNGRSSFYCPACQR
jgi:formamidopyrimidine-DNA glycosylase